MKSSILRDVYSSFQCIKVWSPMSTVCHTHHGGIFNFDFSLDGSVLVAACERQSLLVFDPHNARLIGSQENAHRDCVNYIRFLDSRLFASCSDDKTVCLWDLRYMKKSIMTLIGHSNWVKNIEYARNLGLLVTSGFDGSICTWDINTNRSTDSVVCNPVFHTSGLMRSRLTPDTEKLIITTTEGYIIVIHDLDLTTLSQDLAGFKPSLYRVMQTRGFPLHQAYKYNSLFTRKRNRVELISDFPSGNDAEMIASLDVHPQGWCVASRNTSSDENSEWTCVHDIQGTLDEVNMEEVQQQSPHIEELLSSPGVENEAGAAAADTGSESSTLSMPREPELVSLLGDDASVQSVAVRSLRSVNRADVDSEEPVSAPYVQLGDRVNFIIHSPSVEERIILMVRQTGAPAQTPNVWHMHKNRTRLSHYVEEPNVGRGFIKEICFSNDGRLICSPFGNGVRMLAFDRSCHELCDSVPRSPVALQEIVTNTNRGGTVVSNKFSPTDALLVTGCLEGKIGFHQPFW